MGGMVAVGEAAGASVTGIGVEGSVAVIGDSVTGAVAGRLQAEVRRRHPIINNFFMPPLISQDGINRSWGCWGNRAFVR